MAEILARAKPPSSALMTSNQCRIQECSSLKANKIVINCVIIFQAENGGSLLLRTEVARLNLALASLVGVN